MDYIIVCVSHRRPKLFGSKTYDLLKRTNAPKPILWLNDSRDYKEYSQLYPELEIHVGGETLKDKRSIIQYYYPEGQKIVFIDDDIKNIVVYDESELRGKRNLSDFNALVELAFSLCEKKDNSFWGVYPVDNSLFMKPVIRTNLCYCVGALYGVINKRINTETNYAEDFERSILYWLMENKVLRLDFIGLSTQYYKQEGGLQETRTEDKNYHDKKLLVDTYPTIVKIIEKRGRAEIGFIRSKSITTKFAIPPEI